jgi:hypothetical protein
LPVAEDGSVQAAERKPKRPRGGGDEGKMEGLSWGVTGAWNTWNGNHSQANRAITSKEFFILTGQIPQYLPIAWKQHQLPIFQVEGAEGYPELMGLPRPRHHWGRIAAQRMDRQPDLREAKARKSPTTTTTLRLLYLSHCEESSSCNCPKPKKESSKMDTPPQLPLSTQYISRWMLSPTLHPRIPASPTVPAASLRYHCNV